MGFGIEPSAAFLSAQLKWVHSRGDSLASSKNQDVSKEEEESDSLDALARLPTSVEDQIRQAAIAIKSASDDGKHRHLVRLLLPVIGATDLDDWPGGTYHNDKFVNTESEMHLNHPFHCQQRSFCSILS